MNRAEKNIGSIVLFVVIIIAIGFGGFYLVSNRQTKSNENSNYKESKQEKNIKIDDSKDYIYYTNEEFSDDVEEINYKDINININTNDAKELQNKLNANMKDSKDNVEKSTDDEGNEYVSKAQIIDYDYVVTNKYISLNVNDYVYFSDESMETQSKLSFYVFDIGTGNILSNRDIMKKENVSDQDIRSVIRKNIEDDENADIDSTLAGDYTLSISKTGKVIVNIVVKSYNLDYNISIEMD